MIQNIIITSINNCGKKKTYRMDAVNNIKVIIEKLGFHVEYIEIDEKVPVFLKKQEKALVFNLVPYYEGRFSNLVPATCEFLNIPCTGSGIFTLSTLRNGFFKDILEYHGMTVMPYLHEWATRFSVLGNQGNLVFNGMDVDQDGDVLKGCNLEEKAYQYYKKVIFQVKNALKLQDYFEMYISFRPVQAKEHAIIKVNPCPDFAQNSLFISMLRNIGLDYGDIIRQTIGHAMKRYKLDIPFELEEINEKILKKKQEEASIIY